jgi:Fe-S cluster biogenesis protein NfuA
VKLKHLGGFIIKKFVMMHGRINVKLDGTCSRCVRNDKNLQNLGRKMERRDKLRKLDVKD